MYIQILRFEALILAHIMDITDIFLFLIDNYLYVVYYLPIIVFRIFTNQYFRIIKNRYIHFVALIPVHILHHMPTLHSSYKKTTQRTTILFPYTNPIYFHTHFSVNLILRSLFRIIYVLILRFEALLLAHIMDITDIFYS